MRVLVKLPVKDCSGKDKGKNRIVEEEHVRYQRCSKQLGTRLARASRKIGVCELGRSSRNLFHNKKRKTSALTDGDGFVVTGSKESLSELKKRLENVYPIKANIIEAGWGTEHQGAEPERICWGEAGILYQHAR